MTEKFIIALRKAQTSEQIIKARDWLLYKQSSNGCWENSVEETAIVLWALTGRSGRSSSGSGSTPYCTDYSYFCIPKSDCPSNEDVGNNYFCTSSTTDTCCTSKNLKSCSQYEGKQCEDGQTCVGIKRESEDIADCCVGTCREKSDLTECEEATYTCMSECSDIQDPVSTYDCEGSEVCCKLKSGASEPSGFPWIWVIIIIIIIAIAAAAYIYREKLKLLIFQLKTRFKKDKGGSESNANAPRGPGGMPPRPGFPPIRRRQRPPMPMSMPSRDQSQRRSYDRRDPAMSDTFKKLREMSN